MKKNIFTVLAAAAMLTLGMTSCNKEVVDDIAPAAQTSNVLVKTAADLIGTNWEYTVNFGVDIDVPEDLADCIEIEDLSDLFTMTFGLNFDESYAHLTFPEDVIGLNVVEIDDENYSVEEITEMAYTYTYEASTTSGTLTGGNLDDIVLPFTYDEANDIITIEILFADENDEANAVPVQLVFTRAN